ncbi:MAG TPA: ribosome assembly RNA-binding protein YhbY [Arenimonas sp.]|nr:ribosome assembly RNA-binding protein YhbY [Arenimonas sp.]
MSTSLSNPQKRYLRGLAHDLKPIIMVGAKGPTDTLIAELDSALERHELIKVKFAAEDRETRDTWIDQLIEKSGASLISRIGNVAIVFRRSKDKALIILPKA